MTRIEADVTHIDGQEVFDKRLTLSIEPNDVVQPPTPEPDPDPPAEPGTPPSGNDELETLIGAAVARKLPDAVQGMLAGLPDMPPDRLIDPRDRFLALSNNQLTSPRFRNIPGVPSLPGGTPDAPAQAPVINTAMGTRGTVYLPDEGAKEGDTNACRAAMASALGKVRDGGRVFVPWGQWPMHDVKVPSHRDIVIEGETELGATLVGLPGRDILYLDEPGAQLRLQNRHIFRNLRFRMRGDGNKGAFNRRTELGFQPGAAAIAIRMDPREGDRRKESWAASYFKLEHIAATADKNAIGATLFYSDRPTYGFRANHISIGDHGNEVSGLHGGIILGRPPVKLTEATSDKFRVETMIHWGGVCSIAAYGVANGAVIDHEVYACEMAIHLTGYDDKSGNRSRCRQMVLDELYYDNDVRPIGAKSPPMVHVNSDTTILGSMHIKGARSGDHSPVVEIAGRNFRGGVIDIMSSAHHRSPVFEISGDGHDFAIEPAGVPSAHMNTWINGGRSYSGVQVI